MTKETMSITPEMTVNAIIAAHAETIPIFNDWGVDSCCGGALPVATVAEKHGFDLERLLGDLNGALKG
jgi:regulator of cell morphogenesis and NO signaling